MKKAERSVALKTLMQNNTILNEVMFEKDRIIYSQRQEIENLKYQLTLITALAKKAAAEKYLPKTEPLTTDRGGTKTEAPHSTVRLTGDGLGLPGIGGKVNPMFTSAPGDNIGERIRPCVLCKDWHVTTVDPKTKDGDILNCPGCGKKWIAVVGRMAPVDNFHPEVLSVAAKPATFAMVAVDTHYAKGEEADLKINIGDAKEWPAEDE